MLTKMSVKGQVVIPKGMRDECGWQEGTQLEVVQTPQGVLLRTPPHHLSKRKSLTVDEALARIRKRFNYDGPTVSIEDMNESIAEMWKQAATKSDR